MTTDFDLAAEVGKILDDAGWTKGTQISEEADPLATGIAGFQDTIDQLAADLIAQGNPPHVARLLARNIVLISMNAMIDNSLNEGGTD
jgi:hypothetical protein